MAKYHNKKTMVDGIKFDSDKEDDYYCELRMLKMAGVVKDFVLQPKYELQPKYHYKGKTVRAINYVADFKVFYTDGHIEVVDVKGVRTKEYLLKRKMLLFNNPEIDFVEV